MASSTNILKNTHLNEGPLPSAEYNKLPHIDDMKDVAAKNANAHAILLGIIAAHGVADKFSVHLVHKHFDIPDGRVMVYETVSGKMHGDFVLCSPRVPEKCTNLRGLYFTATPGGNMAAYEFTTEPGEDLSAHEDFDIFALTVLSICPENKVLTEFEMESIRSTVLVFDASWLPDQDIEAATSTDWTATSDYIKYSEGPIPGIVQLKCLETRTHSHYNITCSSTRSGKHYESRPVGPTGEPYDGTTQDLVFTIGGEAIKEGTEAHAIMSHVMTVVEAA